MTSYAYEYQNRETRGWVRGEFDAFGLAPANRGEAETALDAVARTWVNGTMLRLVEFNTNGAETYLQFIARGSRGPLPEDKQSR